MRVAYELLEERAPSSVFRGYLIQLLVAWHFFRSTYLACEGSRSLIPYRLVELDHIYFDLCLCPTLKFANFVGENAT